MNPTEAKTEVKTEVKTEKLTKPIKRVSISDTLKIKIKQLADNKPI